jgi:non-heme chloroperoxidase
MAKAPPVPNDATVTNEERRQVTRANKSGKTRVVFVHGLWLLPSSWDRWVKLFERNGCRALSPGWPDDPDSVTEAKARAEVFARKASATSPTTTRRSSRSSTPNPP